MKGPAVIAFFDRSERPHEDENEVLSDFRFYAGSAGERLANEGISLHVVYGRSFALRLAGRAMRVKTADSVGYYLIEPGKKPLKTIGVMTDSDLLDLANHYFGRHPR